MKKILLLLLLSLSFVYANIGKITALKGDVTILRANANIVGKLGSDIFKNDSIKTGKNARAQVVFKDNTIISLGTESVFSINEYLFEEKKPVKASFGFGTGIFKTITGKIGKINPKKFKLKTKSATIGIRGTIVGLESTEDGDKIVIPQGEVVVETPDGIVNVGEGQMTEVKKGEPPVVTEAPKEEVEKVDEGSGAKENEEESGQGEATQTKVLTKKEKEEAKEQQATEEETTTEEEKTEETATEEEKTEEEATTTETTNNETTTENETPTTETEVEVDTDIVSDIASEASDAANDATTETRTETTVTKIATGSQLSIFDTTSDLIDANDHTLGIGTNTLDFSTLSVNGGSLELQSSLSTSGGNTTYSTGMSSIGTLSFKKTNNSKEVVESYNLYSDNKKEFFIGKLDNTDTNEAKTSMVFGQDGYVNNFVSATNSN